MDKDKQYWIKELLLLISPVQMGNPLYALYKEITNQLIAL